MIEIIDCAQNSEEWLRARLGIPTASQFATVMAQGRGGGESVTRRKYLYQLAGEIVTGEPAEGFTTPAMERGHEMEGEARDLYAFIADAEPLQVGFVKNATVGAGCSPDALLGEFGALEIKTKAPHVLIETLLRGDMPPEHKAQCQGVLLVTGRAWIDLFCYWPKMPPFRHRSYRDEEYLKTLKCEISRFNEDLAAIVEKIRSYGPAA
jgi:hypothetical protein